jgi:hypothetical protein
MTSLKLTTLMDVSLFNSSPSLLGQVQGKDKDARITCSYFPVFVIFS